MQSQSSTHIFTTEIQDLILAWLRHHTVILPRQCGYKTFLWERFLICFAQAEMAMETEEQLSTFKARAELKVQTTTVLQSYLIAAWFVSSMEVQLYQMKTAEKKEETQSAFITRSLFSCEGNFQ